MSMSYPDKPSLPPTLETFNLHTAHPVRLPPRMHLSSRLALLVVGSLVATLLSVNVRGTRLEIQDWDCPPEPASCARPVVVRGFPLSYISDYHGISVVGDASLLGALLGEDHFRAGSFLADAGFFAALLAASDALITRARKRGAVA